MGNLQRNRLLFLFSRFILNHDGNRVNERNDRSSVALGVLLVEINFRQVSISL